MKISNIIGVILIGLLIIAFGGLIIALILGSIPKDCIEKTYTLKGVNGITDEDSGLFSSGDVSRTSLLMDNGEIITLNYRIKKLYLNQPITIRECSTYGGTKKFSVVD